MSDSLLESQCNRNSDLLQIFQPVTAQLSIQNCIVSGWNIHRRSKFMSNWLSGRIQSVQRKMSLNESMYHILSYFIWNNEPFSLHFHRVHRTLLLNALSPAFLVGGRKLSWSWLRQETSSQQGVLLLLYALPRAVGRFKNLEGGGQVLTIEGLWKDFVEGEGFSIISAKF